MKTNPTEQYGQGAPEPSERLGTGKQRKWFLFIGNELFGSVHASSEAEALDRVAALKKPFRAVPAPEE